MAAVDDSKLSSHLYEGDEPAASANSAVDLSFIHWGYLNSALVSDPTKNSKDLSWKTYWVDLCGSTLRLYRDLSLSPDSSCYPPPSRVIGPSNANEKKEAFLVLKKGASISIGNNEEFKSKKKSKKAEPARSNVFKLQVVNSNNSPIYLFEGPSKSSMYRWISKIEEGIDMADNPQNFSSSDKKLKEAKLLLLESRRYQNVAPELKYSENKDDTDSGMEGDVEETFEFPEKPPTDPRLGNLLKQLQIKQDALKVLEEGENAFIGQSGQRIKVREFIATTKRDYYLIPGYTSSFIPKHTQIHILGQLPNRRWRCYVDLPFTQSTPSTSSDDASSLSDVRSSTSSSEDAARLFPLNGGHFQTIEECTDRLLGSVPTSLLLELNETAPTKPKQKDLIIPPIGTPDVTPNASPYPSPPQSPYSPHRGIETNFENGDYQGFQRRSPTNLQRFVPSMDLSDVDAWEQFIIPSPPSTPVTSRSTTPSLSPSASLETLDAITVEDANEIDDVIASLGRSEQRRSSPNDVRVTYLGGENGGEQDSTNEESRDAAQPHVVMRRKDAAPSSKQKNYSFLVTKKLRQRGISLIVGSSSSEDEDEGEDKVSDGLSFKPKVSRRKLDAEFERFAADDNVQASVRPYSAFVPRKSTNISFGISPKNMNLRTTTTDELLKDYSSTNPSRSNTCLAIKRLGGPRTPENAPPLNQRRTIQMSRSEPEKRGFGFTLQTYGIVQQNGEVEYMTFVLAVEEDGPAYMAGMRPGDIIIAIENQDVEQADHKTIVDLLQKAPLTARLVVVFVDAIKRMHLNTRNKVLRTKLREKEEEFQDLCKKEQKLLTRNRGTNTLTCSLQVDMLSTTRTPDNSYLFTTELTSSFSQNSPNVKDSLVKYKQQIDNKPRRPSLPDHSELTKQSLMSTTGTQILRSFASSAESVLKKSASMKLKKRLKKTKQTSQTFKSYVELDDEKGGLAEEETVQIASPLGAVNCKQDNEGFVPSRQEEAVNGKSPLGKTCSAPKGNKNKSEGDKMTTEALERTENDKQTESDKKTNRHLNVDEKHSNENKKDATELSRASSSCKTSESNERAGPNNIASLRKLFEVRSSPPNRTSADLEDGRDVFSTDCCPKNAPKRTELTRTRLGSRPMSFMCAMDAAEESPLIPDEGTSVRNDQENIRYESSA